MGKQAVRVEIKGGWDRLNRDLMGNVKDAQKILDFQVLKDCQPYVPRDTGNLVLSGVRATKPGDGEVIWDAPYAANQYWNPRLASKAKDVHPLAVMRWFDAAKAAKLSAWLRVAKRAGGKR